MTACVVSAWAGIVCRVEAPFFEHDWQIGPWRNFTNATELIQGAIDDAFRAGGGTVRVAKGSYPIRGLRLRSGVTLYLESGAALLASRDSADFRVLEKGAVEPWDAAFEAAKMAWRPPVRPFIRDAANPWNNAIIRIHNAHDVAIVGEPGSVIDGLNGYNPDGEERYRGVHGVSAFDSTNILYRGFTIRHTGNWALRHQRCGKIRCANVRMLAGHDGFHIRECSDAVVEDCFIHTGDDSIAGYANRNVVVRRCDLSSACSTFRFGGTDVLIEDVSAHGPCEYVFRGSLSPQLKRDGAWDPEIVTGRHSMSAFFRYFCDVTSPVPDQPGNIVVRNCRVENVGRLFRYNLGSETWQQGRRLADLRFERVVARGIGLPIALNAGEDESRGPRLSFTLTDCDLGFAGPQTEIFSTVAIRELKLENVRIWGTGADTPLVRAWGDRPELSARGVRGASAEIVAGTGTYKCIRWGQRRDGMKMLLLAAIAALGGYAGAAEPEGLAYDAAVTSRASGFFRLEQEANGVIRANGKEVCRREISPKEPYAAHRADPIAVRFGPGALKAGVNVFSFQTEVAPDLDKAPSSTWLHFDYYLLEANPDKTGFGILVR